MKHRRDRLFIIAEILDVARDEALKTQILYKASLSFAQLKEHLSVLLESNLLKAVKASEKTFYKTTNKGLKYLQKFTQFRELLKKGKGNSAKEHNSIHLAKRGKRVILLGENTNNSHSIPPNRKSEEREKSKNSIVAQRFEMHCRTFLH